MFDLYAFITAPWWPFLMFVVLIPLEGTAMLYVIITKLLPLVKNITPSKAQALGRWIDTQAEEQLKSEARKRLIEEGE